MTELEKEEWLENYTKYCIDDSDTAGIFEGNADLCKTCKLKELHIACSIDSNIAYDDKGYPIIASCKCYEEV